MALADAQLCTREFALTSPQDRATDQRPQPHHPAAHISELVHSSVGHFVLSASTVRAEQRQDTRVKIVVVHDNDILSVIEPVRLPIVELLCIHSLSYLARELPA